ncbi:zincin [Didymella exigua CBS 183.55]|uniref:Neutral protease 2 n=1 Tax=Didymella exigua CBS 183.55 TaxID=1150837 RepID=A0A6A5RWJ2_9PLEO|nr:zincin [Didymella exigua CBS 183.55]KAF1932865.1 zincin [Didymella exigua CBS 183.55]
MVDYLKSTSRVLSPLSSTTSPPSGSTTSGNSRYYCFDTLGACSSDVLAYTYPLTSQMVKCPMFFFRLTALSRQCYTQDQATTALHEMTHLTQAKGTSDYGGYVNSFVRSLSATQNLNHVDTHTLFAQALSAGC